MKAKSRKKLVSWLLLCAMMISGMATGGYCSSTVYAADAAGLEGSGTKENPYVIHNSEDMWKFAEIVAASSTREECAKVADGVKQIDTTVRGEQTGLQWQPICATEQYIYGYQGVFDGNGAEIQICIASTDNHQGLFGYIRNAAEIRNVTITGSVSGTAYVGGVCGEMDSCEAGTPKIVDCNNKADITGTGDYVGGIIGAGSAGVITATGSMYNAGKIEGQSNVGGIVGKNFISEITVEGDLRNTGTVKGTESVGGIVGCTESDSITVTGSMHNAGEIEGQSDVGGIVGKNYNSEITVEGDLRNTGTVTGTESVGGIVGCTEGGSITATGSMYNAGEIEGQSCVGGIVGKDYATAISAAKNLENTGNVTGATSSVGGLLGELKIATLEAGMDMCNTGKITATQTENVKYIGGLVGYAITSKVISRQGSLINQGSVSGSGDYVAGLIGSFDANDPAYVIQAAKAIRNTGAVSGKEYVGGVCGYYWGSMPMTVENGYAYNTGSVTGDETNVGGVLGWMNVTADAGGYANMGSVTNTGSQYMCNTGGVIGYWVNVNFSLQDVYNTGTVTASNAGATCIGSIAGRFYGVNIRNAYHTTAYAVIGNMEGDPNTMTGVVQNCFCLDTNTTPWEGETVMSAEAFASGEVAYLLDGVGDSRAKTLHWGQEIGVDKLPVLGGKTVYRDGNVFRNTDGHVYGTPEYVWNDAELSCRAVRSCTAKGCNYSETENATVVCLAEVKAGCETKGSKTYRATFENPVYETQTKTIEVAATGHTWKQVIDREATATTAGSSHEECSVCGYQKAAVTIPATGDGQNAQKPAKKGTKLTTGQATVKVTNASAKDPQVSYEAPKSKKAKTVKIPDTVKINGVTYKVTSVAKNAFANQKQLKSVTIGKHVTTIGERAFAGCKKLESITIGKSVTKIGKNAFTGCKNLKKITILTTKLTKKSVAKDAFKGVSADVKIVVPKKKLKAYKTLFRQKGLSQKVKFKTI